MKNQINLNFYVKHFQLLKTKKITVTRHMSISYDGVKYIYIRVYMCTCIYIYIHIHVHMYIYIHIPTYTPHVMYTCIHRYFLTYKNEKPISN